MLLAGGRKAVFTLVGKPKVETEIKNLVVKCNLAKKRKLKQGSSEIVKE